MVGVEIVDNDRDVGCRNSAGIPRGGRNLQMTDAGVLAVAPLDHDGASVVEDMKHGDKGGVG